MASKPQERYQIIERLDAGGMAEVFKAKAVSLKGFEKLVAIKKVLPGLSEDDRFLRMFLDEARLSLFLNHANIVQVFDIGQGADDAFFIVMQFIDGANLKKIIGSLAERNARMPVELAVFVAMEACKGLDYAHNKKGTDGNPLGIVHRDISPPNVLISREGEVKIMDFGLAKNTENLEKTDPGVVKGKFGYLSPEAAHGDEVDLRTDVFAVGIILWEMLSGRRLFLGESDYETLQLVRAAEIPSLRDVNPDVPTELDEIVRKSMARDVDQRYSSCRELGSDLTKFLFSRGLTVTSYDLAALVQRVVGTGRQKSKEGEMSAIDMLIQQEINKFTSFEKEQSAAAAGVALGGGGLFGDDDGGGMGMDDMWGGVFDEVEPDMQVDHIPSGGTKRLESLSREDMETMAAQKRSAPAAKGGNANAPAPRSSPATSRAATGSPVAISTMPPQGTKGEAKGGMSKLWVIFGVLLVLVLLAAGYLMFSILAAPA